METTKTLLKKNIRGQWRWVHVRYCSVCGERHNIPGNATTQKAELGPGCISCYSCGGKVFFRIQKK